MAIRSKRSISMPPAIAREVEREAKRTGTTFSGWLTATASRELKLVRAERLMDEWERENGPFTAEERGDAAAFVRRVQGFRPSRRRRA